MGEPVDSSPPSCSSVLAIFQCISLSLLPIATLIVVDFRCALECREDGGLQFTSVDGLGDIAVRPAARQRMRIPYSAWAVMAMIGIANNGNNLALALRVIA
jgi:hypothetical protein